MVEVAQVQYNLKKALTVPVLAIALGAIIVASIFVYSNMRSELSVVRSELASAKVAYSIVEQEKHRLDSLATLYKHSIVLRDTSIAIKVREVDSLSKRANWLSRTLANALVDVKKLRADSSYAYINRRIPHTSALTYPFDSTQVKEIHYTFVERDGLFTINDNLSRLVDTLKIESFTQVNEINDLKSLNDVYLKQTDICKKENGAYKDEVKTLNKDNKHQRLFKNVSNGAVVGLAIILLIHLL